jgi:hypothetical protein
LERNLEWFDSGLDAVISNCMSSLEHPLTEFLLVHEANEASSIASMGEALKLIKRDSIMPDRELSTKLTAGPAPGGDIGFGYRDEFGHQQVEDYSTKASTGIESLLRIGQAVADVEQAGWPASATKTIESG